MGLLLHPSKADNWNWATDQRCIQNRRLNCYEIHTLKHIGSDRQGNFVLNFFSILSDLPLSRETKKAEQFSKTSIFPLTSWPVWPAAEIICEFTGKKQGRISRGAMGASAPAIFGHLVLWEKIAGAK